jgi:arylsulfatase A-like enzyme
MRAVSGAVVVGMLAGCPAPQVDGPTSDPPVPTGPVVRPNLLLVLLDDVGIERLAPWDRPHDGQPDTPFLDALALDGLVFDNAYAMPLCSPTRYSLLTGRYGRRVGLGKPLVGEAWEVPLSERSLPDALAEQGYSSALAGKWHLSTPSSPTGADHPAAMGFLHHQGSLGNIPYTQWWRVIDGVGAETTVYPTRDTTDAALDHMARLPEPWFVWTAYNTAHAPLHVPPAPLNPTGLDETASPTELLHGMVTAFDLELERLLASVDLTRTTVVFLSDNGTHTSHLSSPHWTPAGGKGSVWESGVRVPLLVVGAGVVPGRSAQLVHAADVFATLLDLAGGPAAESTVGTWSQPAAAPGPTAIDGTSLVPVLVDPGASTPRELVYTERFGPLGAGPHPNDVQALRDDRYKLIRVNGTDALHDLAGRHDDGEDLLTGELTAEEQAAYDRLVELLERHTARLSP